ncbi:MAG TPA: hypothetical protein VFE24_06945 [Pirellulales bacterium]|jgi:hypothetical protein|nr:hypothetical protein [Pirellulales bacterium]
MELLNAPARDQAVRDQRRALGWSGLAWVLFVIVVLIWPAALWRGYLVAFNFWLGVALGSLVLIWLHQLVGGGWGWVIRPVQAAASSTIPFFVLAALPLALGLHALYPWTSSEFATTAKGAQKSLYLNEPFFLGRSLAYFAIWLVLGWLTTRWIEQEDRSGDARAAGRLRTIAGPGIVLYGLTITLAGVDWLMSLQPDWFSTIFSVVFSVGQILAASAFAVVGAIWLMRLRRVPREVSVAEAELKPAIEATNLFLRDLGNLLLLFVMFWAYVSFSQFLLIWSGNLPEEIRWYLPRTQGVWKFVAIGLALGQFGLPFLLLLSREIKRRPAALVSVAALLLFTHWVDLAWQILPAFPAASWRDAAADVAAAATSTVGLGGLWLWAWLRRLRTLPLASPPDGAIDRAAIEQAAADESWKTDGGSHG